MIPTQSRVRRIKQATVRSVRHIINLQEIKLNYPGRYYLYQYQVSSKSVTWNGNKKNRRTDGRKVTASNIRLKFFTIQTLSTIKCLKWNLEIDVLWTGSIRVSEKKRKGKPTQLDPRGKAIERLYTQISSKWNFVSGFQSRVRATCRTNSSVA